MSEKSSLSRRTFLAAGSLAAAGVTFTAKSYARVIGANDRIRVGFIGAGGMGSGHIDACLALKDKDNLEFLGVADCWRTRAAQGAAKLETQPFADYRKLLETGIDYVTIATPEHWHAQ